MNKPQVTILMATYNDSLYIKSAIDSVLNQTFKNWEFIIINDNSTDNTADIIKDFVKSDKRIIYIENTRNVGLTENLNKGIDIARGEFIARIDGDDYWTDNTKLHLQLNYMLKNPTCGVVGCFAYAIDKKNKKLFEIKYPHEDIAMRKIMLKHCCLLHSTVVLRKSILTEVNKYNTKYPYAQDYDLYLKMGTISLFHNIPKFMVNYRINPSGTTQTKFRKQTQEMVDIIKEYKTLYPNYFSGYLLWNVRKFYPSWFRGAIVRKIKDKISILGKMSGA